MYLKGKKVFVCDGEFPKIYLEPTMNYDNKYLCDCKNWLCVKRYREQFRNRRRI